MAIVTSTYTVIPSEETPKGCMWLSGSDQINPWTHAPTIYVYRPHQTPQGAIDTLRHSLANILVPYYPLAGRLRWIGGGRLEVDCNAMGVKLMEAASSKRLDEYDDFQPNQTIQKLVPKVDYSKPIEDIPLLLVQLTSFSCGGLSIAIAISHSMVDGVAAIQFINSWAKLARGHTLEQHEMPFLDRTVLKCRQPLMPPRFDHPEYKPLDGYDNKEERKKETSVELLKLTREQVEKIKKKASEGMKEESRAYTRYEAITAHIWRCACKARRNDYHLSTAVRIIADIRNRLQPRLPPNYFGNAILRAVAKGLCGNIISNPLSYAAGKIREGIEVLREEQLRSQLDLIESEKDVNTLRVSFHSVGCEEAPFFGNPNMAIGSWTSMPIYDADFGWGKAVYMGPGSLNADGKVFIVPAAPTASASLIVAIRLQTAVMDDFINFFHQDL